MESCIKQNNAIEIYQDYFNEIDEATDCEEPKAKVSIDIIMGAALFLISNLTVESSFLAYPA